MRVFIDGAFYKGAGIGRYYETVVEGLLNRDEIEEVHTAVPADREDDFRKAFPDGRKIRPVFVRHSYFTVREFLSAGALLRSLERSGVEVFHFPHVNLPLYLPPGLVVTIHDLRPLTSHNDLGFLLGKGYEYALGRTARRAKVLLAVSATVREEMEGRFPLSKGKIRVTYNVAGKSFLQGGAPDKLPMVEGEYLLFVGNRMRHKNLEGLLEGFGLFQELHPHVRLVIAGRRVKGEDPVDRMRRKGRVAADSVVELPQVGAAELLSLYRHAKALVLLSFYEGFGFPPLEAMTMGVPAVLSDIPVFRELFQGAALFVDPRDPGSIAEGLERVLRDGPLRVTLVREGRLVAGKLEQEDPVGTLLSAYTEAAYGNKR